MLTLREVSLLLFGLAIVFSLPEVLAGPDHVGVDRLVSAGGQHCEAPDPLPTVPYAWGPTCLLVRADAFQAESVIADEAARLLRPPPPPPQGPFDLDQFHPLGFSAKGAFAWLELGPTDRGLSWGVGVMDLRTDQPLGSLRGFDDSNLFGRWDVGSIIAVKRLEIDELLGRHGIVVQPAEVVSVPFERDGRSYSARVVSEEGGHAVWLDESTLGTKRLGPLERWVPCDLCGEPRVRVLFSPFEDRAAVVVAHRTSQFESVIPGVTHSLLGARMKDGFVRED